MAPASSQKSAAATSDAPAFAAGSALVRAAYEMAYAAHNGERRNGKTDIAHPVAVAEVLHEHGITDEEVLAAALLHDVIEDTDTAIEEIEARFGENVAHLVHEMTENPAIEPYADRKAEHRRRATRDRDVAAIYAADKLARSRALRRRPAEASPERLEHYLQTLDLLSESHPELPFLGELRAELELLSERAARRA